MCSLLACTEQRVPVAIGFTAEWDGHPINCGENGIGLSDLRFFVSGVALIDTEGREHPLKLTVDSRWQQKGIALLDLENGEGSCVNGNSGTNNSIRGTTTVSDIAGVQFTVGVPFEKNHANPLLAQAPLDDAAMHWHWRSGYKFMRAGVTRAATTSPANGRWLHLGSTGCKGTVQNISGCTAPNRVAVVISEFAPSTDQVAIDLSALFGDSHLAGAEESDCSSGPAESHCAGPFAALGLPFGDSAGGVQRVFRVK